MFHKLNGRALSIAGFLVSAVGFYLVTMQTGFWGFAVLHAIAGIGTGAAISSAHGTIGRTSNPHRVFGLASFGVGLMSMAYLGIMPKLIDAYGPVTLFYGFVVAFGISALVNVFLFPDARKSSGAAEVAARVTADKLDKRVLLGILGMIGMAFNVAMILAFAVQVTVDSGLGEAVGFRGLFLMSILAIPVTFLAAFAQKYMSFSIVAPLGALIQGGLALIIMTANSEAVFIGAILFYSPVLLFTHPFVFGFLAKADPSGRAVASTPIMIMTGSAFGPLLGGFLVQSFGYGALGMAALVIGVVSMGLFSLSRSVEMPREPKTA